MNDDPEAQAHALIDRIAAMLHEAHELSGLLEKPRQRNESDSAEAHRVLYFALTSALEAGLVRTMEDVLGVLRQASRPLGPMGTEWLARQERALKLRRPMTLPCEFGAERDYCGFRSSSHSTRQRA